MQIYTYKKIRVTSFLLLVFSTATFLIPITASQQGSNPSSVAKKYLCTWPGCGKSFARSFHLKRHKLTHTGEKAFTCNTCGKKFTLKNALKIHLKTIHIDTSNSADDSELVRALKKINQAIVNHKLKMDEETRKSMPSLTPEIEQELLQMAEEIEKRPYECGWPGCGKRFSFHTNLIRHKKIHTRKTLYECNVL